MNRFESLNRQFNGHQSFVSSETVEVGEGKSYPEILDHDPDRGIKLDFFNRYGWGYTDSGFALNKDKDAIMIKGNRYMYGGKELPKLLPFVQENMGITDVKTQDTE